MAHAVGLRATSLAASTALLGLAVIAGLTMTIVQRSFEFPEGPGTITFVQPQTPPEPPRPRPQQPPVRPVDGTTILPIEPPADDAPTQISESPPTYAPPIISNPEWVRRPRDLARYYPARALLRGAEGQAVLDCGVSVRGALSCVVVSETPPNWGFGEAALRISRDYQMVPASQNGIAIEGRYRMVVPFQMR